VIGDDRDRLAEAVRAALSRSAIVILSGGLGPTEDDVTREAVALALDRKLVFHPEIAAQIEARFARMKRKMVEVNRRQAFVIEGADVLPNDRGTAPGQWVEESGVVILLPGPPHELKAMFERQCLPRLRRLVPDHSIRTLLLRVTGMPESDLDQLISPVYKKYLNRSPPFWPATAIFRCTCAPDAPAWARQKPCWPKSARPSKRCWATRSTPAMAIRWRWWSARCCTRLTPRWLWRRV